MRGFSNRRQKAFLCTSQNGNAVCRPVTAPKPKVDICHHDEFEGTWHLINVSENAKNAHLSNHDDGLPGDTVPGQPGFIFGPNCELVQDVCNDATVSGTIPNTPSESSGDVSVYNDQGLALKKVGGNLLQVVVSTTPGGTINWSINIPAVGDNYTLPANVYFVTTLVGNGSLDAFSQLVNVQCGANITGVVVDQTDPPVTIPFTANQEFGSGTFEIFTGTDEPGETITVTSAYGGGVTNVDAFGQWVIAVNFVGAPIGVPFNVNISSTSGGNANFTFVYIP